MPLSPDTLSKIKNGTLESLNIVNEVQKSGRLIDQDWTILKEFLVSTKSLKILDLTGAVYAIGMLSQSLQENKSVTQLNLRGTINDTHVGLLSDILRANPCISELILDECYLQRSGVYKLGKFLDNHHAITHISLKDVNADDKTGVPQVEPIVSALKKSPNILSFVPTSSAGDELAAICSENARVAKELVEVVVQGPELMTEKEMRELFVRMPAFLSVLENTLSLDRKGIAQIFVGIEDAAKNLGLEFTIPARFADISPWLPRPFRASGDRVAFDSIKQFDARTAYKAAEAGQVDELLGYLTQSGKRLTAEDWLGKPEGKRDSLIGLIARQGKLATVMTVGQWTGYSRDLKEVAAGVPELEWRRQMKDLPLERLMSLVNAASFKKARHPGLKPGF